MTQTRMTSMQRFARLSARVMLDVRREAIDELNDGADSLVAQMQQAAPLGPTGNLRKSIRKEAGPKETRVLIKAGGPLTTVAFKRSTTYQREVKIGSGDTAGIAKGGGAGVTYDYANAVEFGVEGNPARPFFWPSWRLRRKKIRSKMKRRITANIKQKSA